MVLRTALRSLPLAALALAFAATSAAAADDGQDTPVPLPCAPTGFAVEPLGVVMHLTWDDTLGATEYRIYRADLDNGEELHLAILMSVPSNETIDTQIEPNHTYHYAMTAVFGTVESDPCGVVEVTSNDICSPDVSAFPMQDGSIRLTWTAVTVADSYNVYRAEGDGDFHLIGTTDASTQGFIDADTEPGTVYRYTVTYVVDGNEREPCSMAEVTAIPSFPTAFGLVAAAGLGVAAYAVMRRKA